jgi:hypothetical protein
MEQEVNTGAEMDEVMEPEVDAVPEEGEVTIGEALGDGQGEQAAENVQPYAEPEVRMTQAEFDRVVGMRLGHERSRLEEQYRQREDRLMRMYGAKTPEELQQKLEDEEASRFKDAIERDPAEAYRMLRREPEPDTTYQRVYGLWQRAAQEAQAMGERIADYHGDQAFSALINQGMPFALARRHANLDGQLQSAQKQGKQMLAGELARNRALPRPIRGGGPPPNTERRLTEKDVERIDRIIEAGGRVRPEKYI